MVAKDGCWLSSPLVRTASRFTKVRTHTSSIPTPVVSSRLPQRPPEGSTHLRPAPATGLLPGTACSNCLSWLPARVMGDVVVVCSVGGEERANKQQHTNHQRLEALRDYCGLLCRRPAPAQSMHASPNPPARKGSWIESGEKKAKAFGWLLAAHEEEKAKRGNASTTHAAPLAAAFNQDRPRAGKANKKRSRRRSFFGLQRLRFDPICSPGSQVSSSFSFHFHSFYNNANGWWCDVVGNNSRQTPSACFPFPY